MSHIEVLNRVIRSRAKNSMKLHKGRDKCILYLENIQKLNNANFELSVHFMLDKHCLLHRVYTQFPL